MSATADLIGAAVAAGVTALALPGLTVVRGKLGSVAAKDARPVAVVSVGAETVERLWGGSQPADLVTYPVSVSVVTDGGQKLAEDSTLRQWREQIRNVLNAPSTYATVPGATEVTAAGGPAYESTALGANLNRTTVTARVQVIEARAT